MSKPVLVAAVLTAVLAFPAAALADNSDSFAGARNGQADLPLDEEVVDGNLGYGTEPGEVVNCATDDADYGATAWYRFIAARSGRHVLSTFGSNFDTVLTVYVPNGASIPTGAQERGCNDDADNDGSSFVEIDAVAGQAYYVQVGGYDDGTGADQGSITMAVYQPPENDDRSNAVAIGVGGGVQGYNFNAGQQQGEPTSCGGIPYGSTTWYKVVAPAIGDASVTVTSTDMDPVVAVLPAGSNTPIACNDDGPGQTTSASLSGRVAPGEYFIQVGGIVGQQGFPDEGTYEVRVSFTEDTDLDDDGVPRGRDCNDGDAAIRPGAAEAVNNDVDENCDGVKEFDRDGDGSRVPGNPADCDDNNPARSPLKPETAGNAVDENCDNVVAPYPSMPSRVAPVFDTRKGIKLVSLSVFNSRKGSTLTIRCQGRGCRFGKKSVKITAAKKELRLEKRLARRQRSFKPRQRLTFTLSGQGWSTRVKVFTMRGKHKFPRSNEYCIKNGQKADC
jgi:hypothetical protein